ncbi:MAG: hypothetical protein DMG63_07945 [Acidobacteria bacterium]|nr:MAG: hypothetical protein DMG63_07945 [Acidobacteriota bacterium]
MLGLIGILGRIGDGGFFAKSRFSILYMDFVLTMNSSILSGGGFPRAFSSAGDRRRRIFCFAFRVPIQLRHSSV